MFLRKIVRGATATSIPILANTKIERGDIVTLVGRTQDIAKGFAWLFLAAVLLGNNSPLQAIAKAGGNTSNPPPHQELHPKGA